MQNRDNRVNVCGNQDTKPSVTNKWNLIKVITTESQKVLVKVGKKKESWSHNQQVLKGSGSTVREQKVSLTVPSSQLHLSLFSSWSPQFSAKIHQHLIIVWTSSVLNISSVTCSQHAVSVWTVLSEGVFLLKITFFLSCLSSSSCCVSSSLSCRWRSASSWAWTLAFSFC